MCCRAVKYKSKFKLKKIKIMETIILYSSGRANDHFHIQHEYSPSNDNLQLNFESDSSLEKLFSMI